MTLRVQDHRVREHAVTGVRLHDQAVETRKLSATWANLTVLDPFAHVNDRIGRRFLRLVQNLFAIQNVAPDISLNAVAYGVLPFTGLMIVAIFLL